MSISETPDAVENRTYNITVSWNGSSFSYSRDPLRVRRGMDTINFNRKAGETWKFLGIAIYPEGAAKPSCDQACSSAVVASPFGPPTVADGQITVIDNNPGGTRQDFYYRVCINASTGVTYCGDPEIINRAD
jgi:hypothetical protein